MKINDKVRSKNKDGMFQGIGTVKALFDSQYYANMVKVNLDSTWSVKFPDWKEKPVVVVVFDEYKKSATEKEWIESAMLQNKVTTDYSNCPMTNCLSFPYDDLELVLPEWFFTEPFLIDQKTLDLRTEGSCLL